MVGVQPEDSGRPRERRGGTRRDLAALRHVRAVPGRVALGRVGAHDPVAGVAAEPGRVPAPQQRLGEIRRAARAGGARGPRRGEVFIPGSAAGYKFRPRVPSGKLKTVRVRDTEACSLLFSDPGF
mgnify:CR=1 FL=1